MRLARGALAVPLAAAQACDAARFGPKAANLAALARAGLPTPGGFCVDAEVYRLQLAHLGLEAPAHRAASAERPLARRLALEVRLGLLERPVAPALLDPLLAAWRTLSEPSGALAAVRSSALVEDRAGATFAGQFESYLGLAGEVDFLTAVRACWAALWASRALGYMAAHDLDPAATAMALLVQPLVAARASGGGLSRTAGGEMLLTAAPGPGSAIAQGEVVPDRFVLTRDAALRAADPGHDGHRQGCAHHAATAGAPSSNGPARPACLDASEASQLGRLLRAAEDVVGVPVEIEWALDAEGFKLLQARHLQIEPPAVPPPVPDDVWLRHPGLTGQGSGIGWSSGRACVVSCECELTRVAPGDVLVTRVGGPALSHVLPRVAAVVAELGGSTSHLASLGRERRIPMVLGVLDATRRIPEGVRVAVDGVAGIVRWVR
jgi:phosphoenolpyruvate synthase/pyruvate phosphate dikinase